MRRSFASLMWGSIMCAGVMWPSNTRLCAFGIIMTTVPLFRKKAVHAPGAERLCVPTDGEGRPLPSSFVPFASFVVCIGVCVLETAQPTRIMDQVGIRHLYDPKASQMCQVLRVCHASAGLAPAAATTGKLANRSARSDASTGLVPVARRLAASPACSHGSTGAGPVGACTPWPP